MSSLAERLAQVPDDLLRLDREGHVVAKLADLALDDLVQLVPAGTGAAPRLRGDAAQRVGDLADHTGLEDVVRVDLGRALVDVDDLLIALAGSKAADDIRPCRRRCR